MMSSSSAKLNPNKQESRVNAPVSSDYISKFTLKMYVFPWQLQRVNTVSTGEGTPHTCVMPRAGPGTLLLFRNQK